MSLSIDRNRPSQLPVFRDARSLINYLEPGRLTDDMDVEEELERVRALIQTRAGQSRLLQRVQSDHPGMPQSEILRHIERNVEQLRKKESFLMKVLKMPVQGLKSIGSAIARRPVASALVAVAGLLALLYFLPAPPGVGRLRDDMIEGTRRILTRVGVSLPQANTDAIAAVPVTGGPVVPDVIQRGGEILQSPSNVQNQIRRLDDLLPR